MSTSFSANMVGDTAHALAFRMAGYVKDAGYIAAYVTREYGGHRAPTVETVEAMQKTHARRRAQLVRERNTAAKDHEPENDNGEPFKVASLVRHQVKAPPNPEPTILFKMSPIPSPHRGRRIVAAVAEAFDITIGQLRSRSRAHYYVIARCVAARILRDCMRGDQHRFSTPQIGTLLGRNDHSTIIHSLRSFDKWVERYPEAQEIYDRLKGMANG